MAVNKVVKKGNPQLVLKDAKSKQIADVIIYAAFNGDEAAIGKYNVSQRTLSRYRKRTTQAGELASYVSYRLKELEDTEVLDEVERSINTGLEAFQRACDEADFINPDSITAMATWFEVVSNYDLTRKMLHGRLQGTQ